MEEIKTFCGGNAIDDRGEVIFVNDFNFKNVKRFYQIENFSKNIIRAFHGHLKEGKYVYVAEGSIILAAVYLDKIDMPSKNNKVNRFILSDKKPAVIYLPSGYANGFKALEEKTKIIFFSTSTLDESKGDDYRYDYDYWGKDIWESENR